MGATELRQVVERAAPALPADAADAVAAAVHHRLKTGGVLNPAAVRECVELAGTIAEFRERDAPEGRSLAPEGRSPFAELTERQALAAVEGWVRQIRNGLFGATDAPFAVDRYPELSHGSQPKTSARATRRRRRKSRVWTK